MATKITSLDQLSSRKPTRITADTNVEIEGCYLDFDGNKLSSVAKGARWTLRNTETDARIRDLVIG